MRASRAVTVDRGSVRENVFSDITDPPSQYWMRDVYRPFVDHLLQEMDTSISSSESYVAQYITSRQRLNLTLDWCTRCSKTTCQVIGVSYTMEGKVGDGECR